jgi:transketolase
MSRIPVSVVHPADHVFEIGRAAHLRDGGDVTLIANGVMVERALEAAEELADRGVEARVLNMATVRPLDREAVVAAARETGALVTVEEHTVHGGMGSAVAELVVESHPVPMRILGIPGVFAPTGSATELLDHFGLHPGGIRDATLELLETRHRSGRPTT